MKAPRRIAPGVVSLAAVVAVHVAWSSGLVAQGALVRLGLTETTARAFVMSEATSTSTNRRTPIVEAGRSALYKLPVASRGPAATALFAWAKAYVSSAAFKTAYAQHRRDVLGPETPTPQISGDEEVRQKVAEWRDSLTQSRQMAASLPPADATRLLKSIDEELAKLASGEFETQLRAGLAADRSERADRDADDAKTNDERYPADPTRILMRRLREFLHVTADVNFSARMVSLAGGPDGIEFIEKADRQRNWMWQEAVIAGPEATAAARAAAQAWLEEIER